MTQVLKRFKNDIFLVEVQEIGRKTRILINKNSVEEGLQRLEIQRQQANDAFDKQAEELNEIAEALETHRGVALGGRLRRASSADVASLIERKKAEAKTPKKKKKK